MNSGKVSDNSEAMDCFLGFLARLELREAPLELRHARCEGVLHSDQAVGYLLDSGLQDRQLRVAGRRLAVQREDGVAGPALVVRRAVLLHPKRAVRARPAPRRAHAVGAACQGLRLVIPRGALGGHLALPVVGVVGVVAGGRPHARLGGAVLALHHQVAARVVERHGAFAEGARLRGARRVARHVVVLRAMAELALDELAVPPHGAAAWGAQRLVDAGCSLAYAVRKDAARVHRAAALVGVHAVVVFDAIGFGEAHLLCPWLTAIFGVFWDADGILCGGVFWQSAHLTRKAVAVICTILMFLARIPETLSVHVIVFQCTVSVRVAFRLE